MSGIHWIKIRTDMFSDEKIRLIEQLPEADSILVIWVKLLALAGQKNMGGEIFVNDELPYTDEMLAAIFHRKVNTLRLALETFQRFRMIEIAPDRTIVVCNWAKHQSVDRMEKIRIDAAERAKRYRLEQRKRSIDASCDRHVMHHVTPRDASRSDGVTVTRQSKKEKEKEKESKELPPTVPQRGTDADLIADASEAKDWLNELFGRNRPWSDDEDELLAKLLPIGRADIELIKWGYSLSRDSEGWALIDGKRITKPKQGLLALLREFSSELDKWRSARKTIGLNGLHDDIDDLSPEPDGWSAKRKQAAYEEFGEGVMYTTPFGKLPVEYQNRIDARICAETKTTAGISK
jgi:predicted phage replisome organizer